MTTLAERPAALALPDDETLVSRVLQGDRWAEEALYRRHVPGVVRTATRLLARADQAEDLVQDTFVLAFEQLPQLRDHGAFGAWLMQIAIRQVHRRFRRRRLLRTLGLDREEDDATLSQCVDAGASPEVVAELSKIDEVLSSLSSKQRIAWMLRNVEGHSWDEVATFCACSIASVKRYAARAEQRISDHVCMERPEEAE